MRAGGRKFLGVVAILAIALHAVLWAAAPMAAANAVDPFTVICHSEAASPGADQDQPAPANPSPSHACDHCTLCAAAAQPAALDNGLGLRLTPTTLVQLPHPPAPSLGGDIVHHPNRTRGPPAFA